MIFHRFLLSRLIISYPNDKIIESSPSYDVFLTTSLMALRYDKFRLPSTTDDEEDQETSSEFWTELEKKNFGVDLSPDNKKQRIRQFLERIQDREHLPKTKVILNSFFIIIQKKSLDHDVVRDSP